jgi:hypothetical protein
MEQEIHITLRYNLALGDVNLNEIIYRLNELKNLLMLRVTEKIVQDYLGLLGDVANLNNI